MVLFDISDVVSLTTRPVTTMVQNKKTSNDHTHSLLLPLKAELLPKDPLQKVEGVSTTSYPQRHQLGQRQLDLTGHLEMSKHKII